MAGVLDIVALRSLLAIADCGGYRRAAESLHLSQSAVSQHVRRLEQATGLELARKLGRGTVFTADGELLVAEARKIVAAHDDALTRLAVDRPRDRSVVIGATEHAAEVLLPAISAGLQREFPELTVRFRIDRGKKLNEGVDNGSIDAALLLGSGAEPAGDLPLAWYAAEGRRPLRAADEPVPLVVIDGPCTIRRRALQALADHDIESHLVCEAGHLAGVVGAARAGVGIALLADVGETPEGLHRILGLPPVSPEPLHVRARTGAIVGLAASVAAATRAVLADELARTA